MGALMSQLHADQQRLEEAAETIPGLLVMEFDQPASTGREQRLMADNAEQRELIAALQERNAVLAKKLAALRAATPDLVPGRDPNCLRLPIPGSESASVTVEIENNEDEFYIRNVLVGDYIVDAEDLIAALRDEKLLAQAWKAQVLA